MVLPFSFLLRLGAAPAILILEVSNMRESHLWNRAKSLKIRTSGEITGGFDVGFDNKIPEETKDTLMRFVYWVEDHFHLPVTLWVDFKYNHYLIDGQKNRVGYRFYWADFKNYPNFDNPDDIPVIELAVRTEHYTSEEILSSFIEAICLYFAWLSNGDITADPNETEEILQA